MLLYFILGVIAIQFVFPILESLVELIQSYIEVQKGKTALKIAEMNAEIQKINSADSDDIQRAIGFTISDDYEEEVEE